MAEIADRLGNGSPREMVYDIGNGAPAVVLDFGEYRGVKYLIVSRHDFPCSYLALGKEYADVVDRYCHGGVTYSGRSVPDFEDVTRGTHWLGWDYGQVMDFKTFESQYGGKKWTTEELVREAEEAVDRVIDNG